MPHVAGLAESAAGWLIDLGIATIGTHLEEVQGLAVLVKVRKSPSAGSGVSQTRSVGLAMMGKRPVLASWVANAML